MSVDRGLTDIHHFADLRERNPFTVTGHHFLLPFCQSRSLQQIILTARDFSVRIRCEEKLPVHIVQVRDHMVEQFLPLLWRKVPGVSGP